MKLISYALYYTGHAISLLPDCFLGVTYPAYNWCMRKSWELQDKYKFEGMWIETQKY